jgi:hypothetical protein
MSLSFPLSVPVQELFQGCKKEILVNKRSTRKGSSSVICKCNGVGLLRDQSLCPLCLGVGYNQYDSAEPSSDFHSELISIAIPPLSNYGPSVLSGYKVNLLPHPFDPFVRVGKEDVHVYVKPWENVLDIPLLNNQVKRIHYEPHMSIILIPRGGWPPNGNLYVKVYPCRTHLLLPPKKNSLE